VPSWQYWDLGCGGWDLVKLNQKILLNLRSSASYFLCELCGSKTLLTFSRRILSLNQMSENKRLIRLLSSAGGGKTYRLSTRYKELLKEDNQNLKKTLAITFTNKAATEMKERILGLLKEEALKGKDIHSQKLIDHILDNYSDFSVRTIDSFVNSLVKAFSIELGIAPEAEITIKILPPPWLSSR